MLSDKHIEYDQSLQNYIFYTEIHIFLGGFLNGLVLYTAFSMQELSIHNIKKILITKVIRFNISL